MIPNQNWRIAVQVMDFGRVTQVMLYTDTHYAAVENGEMVAHPFEEQAVAPPTFTLPTDIARQIRKSATELLATQLEERSREQGDLEGRLTASTEALAIERARVTRVLDRLLGDIVQ